MKRFLILQMFGALIATMTHAATNFDLAAKATNELGVDLHRQLATGDQNLCISPYSIESALAMTFAGADGETRTEMARVLHFGDATDVPASFSTLQHSLEQMSAKTAELVKQSKESGGPSEPITLNIANRLFAQKGYDFRQAFLSLVKQNYGAAFEPLDFAVNPAAATQHINKWVADQTHDKIRDLIPADALNKLTRLVLANALYLKAPWADAFSDKTTQPEPFFVHGGGPVDVPMMRKRSQHFGYAKRQGFSVVSLPYIGDDLQFVVLLPDDIKGLHDAGIEVDGGCFGRMRKARRARCRSAPAQVQTRTADDCARGNISGAGNENRVRYSARQRKFRQDRATQAERLSLHLEHLSQDLHRRG